jgi:hypothetical protein
VRYLIYLRLVRIAQSPVGYYLPEPSVTFSRFFSLIVYDDGDFICFYSLRFLSIRFYSLRFNSILLTYQIPLRCIKSPVRLVGSLKLDLVFKSTCLCLRNIRSDLISE